MQGRIIKIISNLYTVDVDGELFECRARGKFRLNKQSPLVGDIVLIDKNNYILEIKERINELERPQIANVDYCIVVSSLVNPNFSPFLLDKMLVNVILNDIKPIICFTKYDLLDSNEQKEIKKIIKYYNKIGIPSVINTEYKKILTLTKNKVVVLCGQTGAGKSSLLNRIDPTLNLKTDEISLALGRGKHTTRHVELFDFKGSLIADTPGFSSFDVINSENIRFSFPEFENHKCKFQDCKHLTENECKIKEDVEKGIILKSRYDSYKKMVIK